MNIDSRSNTTEHTEKYWLIFHGDKLLVRGAGNEIPVSEQPPLPVRGNTLVHDICAAGNMRCMAYETDSDVPEGWKEIGLRASYDFIPHDFYDAAGCGFERIFWDRTTRFCSVCGAETLPAGKIMKRCSECGREIFPSVAPAIIVLVHKGDSVLMVRALNFRGSFYGLVAGFVEPGETLEECVVREVKEETGLTIGNIRYFASQPWPYPCGIMIGFNADYVSGEIRLQTDELSAGAFFCKDSLPELPAKLSLARKLVDSWLAQN